MMPGHRRALWFWITFFHNQGADTMGAKNDLNEIYLSGSVVVAGLIGAAAQSWGVFFTALILLVGICAFTKKIR